MGGGGSFLPYIFPGISLLPGIGSGGSGIFNNIPGISNIIKILNELPEKIIKKILKELGLNSISDFIEKIAYLPRRSIKFIQDIVSRLNINKNNLSNDFNLIESEITTFFDIIVNFIVNIVKITEILLDMLLKSTPLISTLIYLIPLLINIKFLWYLIIKLNDIELDDFQWVKPYINSLLIVSSILLEYMIYS